MAKASVTAFRAATGVVITLAIVCFVLRGKGHSDGSHNHDYDKVTTDDEHIRHD